MNSADSFSATYDEARTKFLTEVAAAKGEHERFKHPEKAPDGKDISTDVAWFGPRCRARARHVSGTHGVEGIAAPARRSIGCAAGNSRTCRRAPR
jgi:hypothetical protein